MRDSCFAAGRKLRGEAVWVSAAEVRILLRRQILGDWMSAGHIQQTQGVEPEIARLIFTQLKNPLEARPPYPARRHLTTT